MNAVRRDKPETKYTVAKPKMSEAERKRLQDEHWSWLRFIVLCAFIGGALGVICVWLFLASDIGGLGSMVARSSRRIGVTALLAAGFASTFGMIAMGIGIMVRSDMKTWDKK